jgi:hypothetical protein
MAELEAGNQTHSAKLFLINLLAIPDSILEKKLLNYSECIWLPGLVKVPNIINNNLQLTRNPTTQTENIK